MWNSYRYGVVGFLCVLLTGCSTFSRSPLSKLSRPIPAPIQAKLEVLGVRISERETLCRQWSKTNEGLNDAIMASSSGKLSRKQARGLPVALRGYPGTGSEGMEAGLIFLSAPETPGLPKDYAWNWTPLFPPTHGCRIMDWYGLANAAAVLPGKEGRNLRELVLRKIRDEASRNLSMTGFLIHASVVRKLLDEKRIKMKASSRDDFMALETAGKELRNRLKANDPLLDDKLFAECNRGNPKRPVAGPEDLDCAPDATARILERMGRYWQTEFRESAGLSERLIKVLGQATIRK